MLKFKAKAVAAVELPDINTFAVVLAEDPSGDGKRLELHKALSVNDQQISLGFDTYSISNELGATEYGGVIAWTLEANSLRVQLDADTAKVLGVDDEILVEFSISSDELQALERGLEFVLGEVSKASG
jgi:hypothetical protein